jgi:hypothetical protein
MKTQANPAFCDMPHARARFARKSQPKGETPMRQLALASLGLLAWSLLQAAPASAQLKGNPDNACRNGYFPRESANYRLAKIKGAAGDRIAFHGDDSERCPDD